MFFHKPPILQHLPIPLSYLAVFSDADLLGWSMQYLERVVLVASPTFLLSAGSGNRYYLIVCTLNFLDGDERHFFG